MSTAAVLIATAPPAAFSIGTVRSPAYMSAADCKRTVDEASAATVRAASRFLRLRVARDSPPRGGRRFCIASPLAPIVADKTRSEREALNSRG